MFFRFPKELEFSKKWIVACARVDKFNIKSSHVCSLHFKPDDYKRDLKAELLNIPPEKNKRLLKPDAIPSQKNNFLVSFV